MPNLPASTSLGLQWPHEFKLQLKWMKTRFSVYLHPSLFTTEPLSGSPLLPLAPPKCSTFISSLKPDAAHAVIPALRKGRQPGLHGELQLQDLHSETLSQKQNKRMPLPHSQSLPSNTYTESRLDLREFIPDSYSTLKV